MIVAMKAPRAAARCPLPGSPFAPPAPAPPAETFAVHDQVTHDKYGLGLVTVVDGVGTKATATIDFGSSGTVRLMLIGGVPMQKL